MVEYYYELQIKPQSNYDVFFDLTSSLIDEAFEENDGAIIIRSENSLNDIEFGILEFSKQLNVPCETKLLKLKNEDWINKYKESIKAVEVGSFFIHPTWEEPKSKKLNIIIHPALSFGSGHHETTSNCLLLISKYVKKDDELLDVGTGSGILAIGASKLGALVDICDTDDFSINDAKQNFIKNGSRFNKAWVGSSQFCSKKYDVVVANIVADVLIMISKDLDKCLKDGGLLILSGILDKHIDKVLQKYSDLKQIDVIHDNEWVTVVFEKIGV